MDHRASRQVCLQIMYQRLEDDCFALLEKAMTDVFLQVCVCAFVCACVHVLRQAPNQPMGCNNKFPSPLFN